MVYISDDGKILQSTPWSLRSITNFFSAIIYMIVIFFKTLFGLETDKYDSGTSRGHRPGFGPPGPPKRKLGRIDNTKGSINVPLGGCTSCQG